MIGGSFSLTEKLAVTGAFLALVALAVGTEDDPGLVIAGREAVVDLRAAAPAAARPVQPPHPQPTSAPAPPAVPPSLGVQPTATPTMAPMPASKSGESDDEDADSQFSPELGRVPLDFSKGPPPG